MGNKATTYVLLIRHGENDWVGAQRLAGRIPGVHLNDNGREQAASLVARLAKQPLAAVYSSPLERCMETAQPTADSLGMPVLTEAGLIEVDYGEWQGAALADLTQLPEWHLVQHYPSTFRFPAGETLREVQHRAVAAIEKIHAQHPNQTVAVFSHGDVIRTALAHYFGTPLDLFQRLAIGTASISIVAFFDQKPMILGVNYAAEMPIFEVKPENETT